MVNLQKNTARSKSEKLLVAGCWILDAGYWMLPARMTRSDRVTDIR
ncbi:MAG TPA: hypothetical protein VLQ91_00290 [Draconibacterium sp.]|nr:hypothetical protein [Draconibacterium sp.]